MYLLFDTSLAEDWPYLLVILAIVVGVVLYYNKAKKDQVELKEAEHDAYSHVVNDSSYNIDHEGIDGHRSEHLSKDEAQQTIDQMKQNGEIPSREEYQDLKDDLKQ